MRLHDWAPAGITTITDNQDVGDYFAPDGYLIGSWSVLDDDASSEDLVYSLYYNVLRD